MGREERAVALSKSIKKRAAPVRVGSPTPRVSSPPTDGSTSEISAAPIAPRQVSNAVDDADERTAATRACSRLASEIPADAACIWR